MSAMPRKQEPALVATVGARAFRIVADAGVGFYLYVFEDGRCTHDYLQDTEKKAKEFAAESFGVPASEWKSTVV